MNIKGKTLFVAGPTWGHIDMNRPALEEAGRRLRNRGAHTCVMSVCDPGDTHCRQRAMAENVSKLTLNHEGEMLYDALVLLPKSDHATDCMLLRDVAVSCGMPVLTLERALS